MKGSLDNFVIYGIKPKIGWSIVGTSGRPRLDIPYEFLIAEDLEAKHSPAESIAKLIGDGKGNFGISITSIDSKSKMRMAYITTLNESVVNRLIVTPDLLTTSFIKRFNLDAAIMRYCFGSPNLRLLSKDLISQIVLFFLRLNFSKRPITLRPASEVPLRGLFSLLSLVWRNLSANSRKSIYAIYPAIDRRGGGLLFSSRIFSHANIGLERALNFAVRKSNTGRLTLRYLTFFDFIKSLWPF